MPQREPAEPDFITKTPTAWKLDARAFAACAPRRSTTPRSAETAEGTRLVSGRDFVMGRDAGRGRGRYGRRAAYGPVDAKLKALIGEVNEEGGLTLECWR